MWEAPVHDANWRASIIQLMDEHHLVVLGSDARPRDEFANGLCRHLDMMPDTDVVRLGGDHTHDLDSFCHELQREFNDSDPFDHSVHGIIELLRYGGQHAKLRYIIWEDADMLLESDVQLFGRVVNALLGVAAEREHISPDLLLLQRVVFLGGDKLGAYAEYSSGQFRTWELEDGTTPFHEVVSCVSRPPVLTYWLDA